MKKALKWLLKKFLFIWSFSPFLSYTIDKNYGTVEIDISNAIKPQLKEWRLSLFQIMFGRYIFYILTLDTIINSSNNQLNYRIRFFHKLSLEDIFKKDQYNDNLANTYKGRIYNICDNEKIQAEKESLLYHIENEEKRIDKSDTKINLYTTIILTSVPIVAAVIDYKKLSQSSNIFVILILTSIVAYSLINLLAYICQYISVRGCNKSSFSDLKNENQTDKVQSMIAYQYYFDYQSLKTKADMFVSYIKNMQYWFIILIIVSSFIVVYINIDSCFVSSKENKTDKISCQDYVVNLSIDDLNDIHSDSSINITKIILKAQSNDVRSLTILKNSNVDLNSINNRLGNYLSGITVQYITDNDLSKDEIKIIVYEGESK